jgi:hypothetical protein
VCGGRHQIVDRVQSSTDTVSMELADDHQSVQNDGIFDRIVDVAPPKYMSIQFSEVAGRVQAVDEVRLHSILRVWISASDRRELSPGIG